MSLVRSTGTILAKEIRTEFRSRELLGTTFVFVLIVSFCSALLLTPPRRSPAASVPAFCGWLFYLPGRSCLQLVFLARADPAGNDTLAGLRLAPIDPFSILAGKMAANFLFLLLVELILLPVFAVLYNIAIFPVLRRWFLFLRSERLASRPQARYFPPSLPRRACASCFCRSCCFRCWRRS